MLALPILTDGTKAFGLHATEFAVLLLRLSALARRFSLITDSHVYLTGLLEPIPSGQSDPDIAFSFVTTDRYGTLCRDHLHCTQAQRLLWLGFGGPPKAAYYNLANPSVSQRFAQQLSAPPQVFVHSWLLHACPDSWRASLLPLTGFSLGI